MMVIALITITPTTNPTRLSFKKKKSPNTTTRTHLTTTTKTTNKYNSLLMRTVSINHHPLLKTTSNHITPIRYFQMTKYYSNKLKGTKTKNLFAPYLMKMMTL